MTKFFLKVSYSNRKPVRKSLKININKNNALEYFDLKNKITILIVEEV